ncbi:MAG: acyltransferase [Candidatus Omnitrophica bacterium]|nr:acyltransferase [Candidatus Omnitrophota bacterium]
MGTGKITIKNKSAHIKEITYLMNLGSLIVIFMHALTADMNYSLTNRLPVIFSYNFFYSFIIPLFMFLSGMLFAHSQEGPSVFDYRGYVQKRFKRLILPYVFLSTLAFFPKAFFSEYAMRPIRLTVIDYIKSLLYPWDNPVILFWFLPTLFMISLVMPFFYKISIGTNNNKRTLALTFLFLILTLMRPVHLKLLNIEGVMYYFFYFWIGIIFYANRFGENALKVHPGKLCIGFLAVLLAITYVSTYVFGQRVEMLRFLGALCGIGMSFAFIHLFTNNKKRFMDWISGYSYQIFLLHWFIQIPLRIGLYQIASLPYAVVFLTMLAGGVILPVAISRLVETRIKPLKFILGIR